MSDEIKNSPVKGYTDQSADKIALVNAFKADEERLLRKIDAAQATMQPTGPTPDIYSYDARWLAIARTHFQEGFMALNRAVFQPQRIALPEDSPDAP